MKKIKAFPIYLLVFTSNAYCSTIDKQHIHSNDEHYQHLTDSSRSSSSSETVKNKIEMAQNAETDEDSFRLFLEAGKDDNPEGFYEAGKMVEVGIVFSEMSAAELYEKAIALSIKNKTTDYHGLPIGLYSLIELKFRESSVFKTRIENGL
jgi:hypothetical protein